MRKLSLLFCLFNIVNLTTCVSFSIYNPHPGKNIILTQDTSTCLSGKTHKQWYAFYGSLSINTLNSATFFPSDEYSYKITEIATEEDAAISFILGLFTTISRKTILIEYCALPGEKQTKKIKPNSEKQEEVANPKVNPDILKKINERLEQIAERQITLQNQLNSSKENPGFVSDRDQ